MTLQKLPVQALDDEQMRRRHREVTNLVLTHQHDDSRVRTPAEVSAGITPVNYAYPPGFIERYGTNTTPGTTDMTAALVAANAQSVASGGAPISALSVCHIATETAITGLFRVGRRQCFTDTSLVTFGTGTVNALYPEWWGAKADAAANATSGTQCQDAFEAAIIASTQDGDGAVAIHPISLAPGNYRIDGFDGLFPPAFKMYGKGIHATSFAINSGATGNVMSDSGSASKIELRDFAIYANNRAGLTNGINLGNDTVDYGTEGYISDLWVRDLPAGAPGLYIRGNVGCAGRLIAQDTGGIIFVGTAGMCEQLVNMTPKGFDVGGTNYCTDIGDTRVDSLHIEAPATNTIPLLISAKASIDTVTVSFTNGRTHAHVVEIDADATSYRIGNIFYYFQASPTATITNGNIKLADGTYIGGNASSGSHSGEGGYSSGELFTSTLAGIKAQQFTAFKIRLVNTAGTIQHRIGCPMDSSIAGTLHAKITGVSTTLTNTPTGADGSTAMAAGLKIGSASTHAIYFDTATQVQADFAASCNIVFNNTGTACTLIPQVVSIDINGTTRTRLAMFLQNASTGANVAWATALNDAGDIIDIVFSGYLR